MFVSRKINRLKQDSHVPTVSIGMPVFNGEPFLNKAIESLLYQSFKDFELIVSDNCSTDNTERICRSYQSKDFRITYFRQEINIGAIANFTFVLSQSKGKYFMWAGADDKWDMDWIEKLVQKLEQTGEAAAFGSLQTINDRDENIGHAANGRNLQFTGARLWRLTRYFMTPEFLGAPNLVYSMFNKSLLYHVSWNVDRRGVVSDHMFVFRVLLSANILTVKGTRIHKRLHSLNAGGGIQSLQEKRSFKRRFLSLLRLVTPSATDIDYICECQGMEKVALTLLLPLRCISKLLFSLIIYKKFTFKSL